MFLSNLSIKRPVLATMMIPWDVKMIPLYMEFNLLGWINTLKPLIVPAWFGEAFFIFLLRQYIMTIPMEIDEAARMDGANAWQIYWRIHLPLMAPALVLVGTFHFMNAWIPVRAAPLAPSLARRRRQMATPSR